MVHIRGVMTLVMLATLTACSTVMEANRPAAVNLSSFTIGEKHLDVVARLGAPQTSEKDGDKTCDVYKLYTKGTSKSGKGAIIVGEAAADVFTLGLFEVVATPGEALTKSNTHVVLFCYSPDNVLISVTDEGRKISVAGSNTQTQSSSTAVSAAPAKDAPKAPNANP